MTEVKLTLDTTKEAPRISRSRLAEIRSDLEPRYDDIALIVSELVSNSVRHSKNGPVSVSITTFDDKIRLEVSDSGPCFDANHRRGDGIGLHIVDRIAAEWGVNSKGSCTVWVEVARVAETTRSS